MGYSLSTSWFSNRRLPAAQWPDAAADLGFDALELGYFVPEERVGALLERAGELGLTVSSVHAFSPVPLAQPAAGPEIFSLADAAEEERRAAVFYLLKSLDLAVRAGAKAVVLHGGRVRMRHGWLRRPYDSQLIDLFRQGVEKPGSPYYNELIDTERTLRRKAAAKTDAAFRRSLDEALPHFDAAGVRLCLENLPGLEAYPDPDEFLALARDYRTPSLAYWHDTGHGELKARYGDVPPGAVFPRLLPFLGGVHIHDVAEPDRDHHAPGAGGVDFEALRFLRDAGVPLVFEPAPGVPAAELKAGLELIKQIWR